MLFRSPLDPSLLLPILQPKLEPHQAAPRLLQEPRFPLPNPLSQQHLEELAHLPPKHLQQRLARDFQERDQQERRRFEAYERRAKDKNEPAPACDGAEVWGNVGERGGRTGALWRGEGRGLDDGGVEGDEACLPGGVLGEGFGSRGRSVAEGLLVSEVGLVLRSSSAKAERSGRGDVPDVWEASNLLSRSTS